MRNEIANEITYSLSCPVSSEDGDIKYLAIIIKGKIENRVEETSKALCEKSKLLNCEIQYCGTPIIKSDFMLVAINHDFLKLDLTINV